MWTVVYMAQDKDLIERLQKLLENQNILVMVRPIKNEGGDDSECCYEVLVPESEVEQTHNIIIDAEL